MGFLKQQAIRAADDTYHRWTQTDAITDAIMDLTFAVRRVSCGFRYTDRVQSAIDHLQVVLANDRAADAAESEQHNG